LVDGVELGEVDEVVGDDEQDVFDGLALATSALGRPRYVPSEQVDEIVEGVVRLTLRSDEAANLEEYLKPATSARIEPDDRGGLGETIRSDMRELEGDVLAPIQRHEHRPNLLRRIALWFERRRGRS
jgi:hypothetical protein